MKTNLLKYYVYGAFLFVACSIAKAMYSYIFVKGYPVPALLLIISILWTIATAIICREFVRCVDG